MAIQNANPSPWKEGMGDGCSGVFDFWFTKACNNHDKGYYEGGDEVQKQKLDDQFYADMCDPKVSGKIGSWMGRHGMAKERYIGVRWTTYNFPPGHPNRSEGNYIEAFNWLGPGPGV